MTSASWSNSGVRFQLRPKSQSMAPASPRHGTAITIATPADHKAVAAIEKLIGVGTLRLAWKGGAGKSAESVELHATALGRDGSVYGLSGSEPATVPVGEYRLGTVTATLDDPQGGQRWSFVFSDNGAKGTPRWYKVEKDRTLTIDPVGTPSFEVELVDKLKTIPSGEDVRVQTAMYTGDGLLINVAFRGTPTSAAAQESLGALTTLASTDGQTLGTAHSGFA